MDKTVLKALAVLELLVENPEPCGVTEIGTRLGIAKSNAHRLLATLVAAGYARNGGKGAYTPTLKMWELGSRVVNRVDPRSVAQPFLRSLAAATGETVHLSVLDGADVVYLDKIDSAQALRVHSEIGTRVPAHWTATGKALLAQLADRAARGVLARAREPDGARTDVDAMLRELDQIRRQGFALNEREPLGGIRGAGAPVRDAHGTVVVAVGISGPAMRLTPRILREQARHVVRCATALSAAYGYR